MSRYVSSHDFQGPNLPARPLQSYQSPTRTRHRTRVGQGSNKENKLPSSRAIKIQKPFRDATNDMTSLRYNVDSVALQPTLKPSFLPFPIPQQPFHSTRMRPNSLGLSSDPASTSLCPAQSDASRAPQTPRSACSSNSSSATLVSSEAEQVVTPTTNRRLAIERVRRAASNAAIRKMGLQGSMGWSDALSKPFNFVPEAPRTLETVQRMPSPDQTPAPRGPAYSPRQYTPKPLLLPCKLARSNNIRSPPLSKLAWLSRPVPLSSPQSRSPTAAARNFQFEETSLADYHSPGRCDAEDGPKNECHSPTECPCDMTPAEEPFEEGSTTPCDSSFASEHEIGVDFKQISRPSTPDVDGLDGASDTSSVEEVDEKYESPKQTTTVFRWALVASEEIPGKSEPSKEPPAPHPHRKSLGCWRANGLSRDLGADMPIARSRSCSEPDMDPRPSMSKSAIQESVLRKIIPMEPIARPTFSLPSPDKRLHVWTNLRNISSPRTLWSTLLSHVTQLPHFPSGIPPI